MSCMFTGYSLMYFCAVVAGFVVVHAVLLRVCLIAAGGERGAFSAGMI
jgi:hypothetical protein